MQNNFRHIFLLLGGLLVSAVTYGQTRGSQRGSEAGSREKVLQEDSGIQIESDVRDTVQLRYFTLNDRDRVMPFGDTLLTDLEKYQINRNFKSAALNLGNYGSAARPIRYQSRDNIFTDHGFHQYELYQMDPLNLRYFILDRAFNDLYFSPLAGQRNFVVKAKFARNFKNKVQVTLDYERILQEGFYNDQKTKDTRFVIGLWKRSTSGNHEYFINFAANNANEEINGGVDESETFEGQFARVRNTIDVQLSGDTARHQNFDLAVHNILYVADKKYRLNHRINFGQGYYRYGDFDTDTAGDSTAYGVFLTDTRGLRYFMGYHSVSNDFDLEFAGSAIGARVGLVHKYQKFDDGQPQNRFNELAIKGAFGFRIKSFSSLNTEAQIGIGNNTGNFKLSGILAFKPGKRIQFEAFSKIIRYDAYLKDRFARVTQVPVYDNEFNKISDFVLGGRLDIQGLGINLELTSGVMDNPIYYDNQALPVQLDGSTEYFRAELEQKLQWKFIGIENSVMFQTFSENLYNLPKWYSIHNLFVEMRLFKRKLHTRVGMLYYHTVYDGGLRFMPVTGSFYPTDREPEYFPYSELYANFKISNFRLFFKIDNFTDMIQREEHFQVLDYPQFDYKTRIGIRWILRE